MSKRPPLISALASEIGRRIGLAAGELAHRASEPDRIEIVCYVGYGTPTRALVTGRVIETAGIRPRDDDSAFRNLLDTYRRIESDEIPGARVRIALGGAVAEATADDEGYFSAWLEPRVPLPTDRAWHEAQVELLSPLIRGHAPSRAVARVLVPTSTARFGVISDIDDTVVRTDVGNVIGMARTVLFGSARTRLPFEGVAAFYRALARGGPDNAGNPLFYVSSSPWNLHDLLLEFFERQGIPLGPLILRDWGITKAESLPFGHRSHKLAAIERIMGTYPMLPFILVGDTSQEDPEIYHEVVTRHPSRVLAIYIRNVTRKAERTAAVERLAADVLTAGSALVLADDTLAAARHAAERGWIEASTMPGIVQEKRADEPPPAEAEPRSETVVVERGESRTEPPE